MALFAAIFFGNLLLARQKQAAAWWYLGLKGQVTDNELIHVFGPDIDLESLEIICLILAGQNPNVRFWRGHRSNERFEVAFEEFTYTSYLEAKKQGIIT